MAEVVRACKQCGRERVYPSPSKANIFCSSACSHASRKKPRPKCRAEGCPHRVQRSRTFCSRRCAWLARKGWEIGAKGRAKALLVLRQRYVARLRAKLQGMTTAAQVWRAAYVAGYQACYQGYLRKVRKGDIQVLRERRDREVA